MVNTLSVTIITEKNIKSSITSYVTHFYFTSGKNTMTDREQKKKKQ